MVIDGRGAQGFVKATAAIVLEPEGDKTRVKYTSDAQVGGKIASVGQRLVETSARAIVKESLEGLAENIKIRADAHRAHAAAAPADPAPGAASASDAPAAPAAPVVEYKQADAGKLAGAVAKEVGKTFAPIIAIVVAGIVLVVYLIVR